MPSPSRSTRYDSGRPLMTATTANRLLNVRRTSAAPGSGTAAAGRSTIGDNVPSKSVRTPARRGSASSGANGSPTRRTYRGVMRRLAAAAVLVLALAACRPDTVAVRFRPRVGTTYRYEIDVTAET